MAYSNWGAFVHKNQVRQPDKEDTGVFDSDEKDVVTGLRIFANLLKNQQEAEATGVATPWYKHSHHAVLGSGVVRLAGYKCTPNLYILQENGEVIDFKLPNLCYEDGEIIGATYSYYHGDDKTLWGDYKYSVRHYNGNMIDLELTEPDGTKWTATCGFEYGAGHMD